MTQLSDEVGGDRPPRAGSDIPDPVVVPTILHTWDIALVSHHRALWVERFRTRRSGHWIEPGGA